MYFLIMLIGKANDGKILLGLITTTVFVGIGLAIFFIYKKLEKIRTEKLAKIFQELGFPFQAAVDPVRLERLSGFPLLNIGGGYRHQAHTVLETPTPLCNRYLELLPKHNIDVGSFGSSQSDMGLLRS